MLLRAKVSLVCIFLCVYEKVGWTSLLNSFFPWLFPNFFCWVTWIVGIYFFVLCFSLIELNFTYEVCLQFSCLVVKSIIIDLWYLPWLCKFLVTAYVRYLPSLGNTVQYKLGKLSVYFRYMHFVPQFLIIELGVGKYIYFAIHAETLKDEYWEVKTFQSAPIICQGN